MASTEALQQKQIMNESTLNVEEWQKVRWKMREAQEGWSEGREGRWGTDGGKKRGDYLSWIAASRVPYYHTHTHAHHAALLPTLNNASHRRDGAAAVATRERCGRAETAGRGAARGLAGNRLCTDVIPPSLPPLSRVHPFIPSHPSPSCPPSIQWAERERGYFVYELCTRQCWWICLDLLFSPLHLSNPSICLFYWLSPSSSSLFNAVNFFFLLTGTVFVTVIQHFP